MFLQINTPQVKSLKVIEFFLNPLMPPVPLQLMGLFMLQVDEAA